MSTSAAGGEAVSGSAEAPELAPEQIGADAARPPVMGEGPWSQAGRLGFRAAQVAVALLLVAWAVGNVREVPPDQRAVVTRFGEPVRVAAPGLLLAWPEPIERVVLVPSAERQLDRPIERLGVDDLAALRLQTDADVRANPGYLLTGDLGVAHLNATLTYRVADPISYVIAQHHVLPALERLFATTATVVCAGRRIEVLLAIGAGGGAGGGVGGGVGSVGGGDTGLGEAREAARDAAAESGEAEDQQEASAPPDQGAPSADDRNRLRTDLVEAVNARLADLAAQGAGLGIEVTRVDLTASLPAEAKVAFDAVPRAQQQADQLVANARNRATRAAQISRQEATRQALDAEARASETVAKATTATAAISALSEHRADDPAGSPVATQIYRERMADILHRIGRVTAVDATAGTRLVLPGPQQ